MVEASDNLRGLYASQALEGTSCFAVDSICAALTEGRNGSLNFVSKHTCVCLSQLIGSRSHGELCRRVFHSECFEDCRLIGLIMELSDVAITSQAISLELTALCLSVVLGMHDAVL